MAIFKHFAKAIWTKAKLSKMADFVDEIEIDKDRKQGRNLCFCDHVCQFFMDSGYRFELIVRKKQLKKLFLILTGFFPVNNYI